MEKVIDGTIIFGEQNRDPDDSFKMVSQEEVVVEWVGASQLTAPLALRVSMMSLGTVPST
jgi:hypothetical protein